MDRGAWQATAHGDAKESDVIQRLSNIHNTEDGEAWGGLEMLSDVTKSQQISVSMSTSCLSNSKVRSSWPHNFLRDVISNQCANS